MKFDENVDLEQYIHQIENRLEKCVYIASKNIWKFRCYICKDSKINKNKKRAFIYLRDGNYFYYCHNCGQSMLFITFMKNYFSDVYTLYQFDKISKRKVIKKSPVSVVPVFDHIPTIDSLKFMATRVDKLPLEHSAVKYASSRALPGDSYSKIWHAGDFSKIKELTDDFEYVKEESRLIFPFIDKDKKLVGLHARSYEENPTMRYIIVKLIKERHMIFNFNKLNINERIFVLEGPLKSLFLPNAISPGNSKLFTVENLVPKDRTVLVYDREPRNQQICRNILTSIEKGFSVCLLPDKFEGKDVDEIFIKHSLTQSELLCIVNDHTFRGMAAKLEFQRWKKC
jgi:hypothetical protein